MTALIRSTIVALTLAIGVTGVLAMGAVKDQACSGSLTPNGIFDCR